MRKNMQKKAEEEIVSKTKIPINIRKKIGKEILLNMMIAIIIIIYFAFLILGSIKTVKKIEAIYFNGFSTIIVILAIILFEIAYKKDNTKLAVFGVEATVIAIITLFLPYIIFELNIAYKKYYVMIAYIVIYYVIKSIVIFSKSKKRYLKEVSDIKEIVKKENMNSIVDSNQETSGMHKTLKKRVITKKKKEEKNKKLDNIPKKRGRPKKEESDNIPKEKVEPKKGKEEKNKKLDNIPKKRGRPKKEKSDNIPKEKVEPKKEKEEKNKKLDNIPKKRGRPRKVINK